ncbi:MAG: hypothetical protein JWO91_1096 [Acidobacteriaceae bacterium]|nr:hypothetical protein [Acidobacteriaceae bacterium]
MSEVASLWFLPPLPASFEKACTPANHSSCGNSGLIAYFTALLIRVSNVFCDAGCARSLGSPLSRLFCDAKSTREYLPQSSVFYNGEGV